MKIFLTGGAGDFLAIITYITEIERLAVKEIYYATRAEKLIRMLTPFVFPNLQKEITVCSDFTKSEDINKTPWDKILVDKFCVHSMQDMIKRFSLLVPKEDLAEVHDWSLSVMVNLGVNGTRPYRFPHEIMNVKLADVEDFPFPYAFVHPWSDNQRYVERDFMPGECEKVAKYLERTKQMGVIVNASDDEYPVQSPWLVHRNKAYTFLQAVEVFKKSSLGFIGTASVFSVLTTKKYNMDRIMIKAGDTMRNEHWHLFYYAPFKFNHFIHSSLEFLR